MFKCQKCSEFLVYGIRRGYTWGAKDCEHYYCSVCSNTPEFQTAKSCPVKGCRENEHPCKTERNLNDGFKKQFDKVKIPTCETHADQPKQYICFDPKCRRRMEFECFLCKYDSKSPEHECEPPLDGGWPLEFWASEIKIGVSRYRQLIPALTEGLKKKQLVCNKLADISTFIDARITKLCNLEAEFFIPDGFRSKYELTTEGKDIVVHDKVLKQVEPLVKELLEGWETKSLESISPLMVQIGQLCEVQNAVVNREVKPHIVKTTRPEVPLPPADMDEAKLARHVDLA